MTLKKLDEVEDQKMKQLDSYSDELLSAILKIFSKDGQNLDFVAFSCVICQVIDHMTQYAVENDNDYAASVMACNIHQLSKELLRFDYDPDSMEEAMKAHREVQGMFKSEKTIN